MLGLAKHTYRSLTLYIHGSIDEIIQVIPYDMITFDIFKIVIFITQQQQMSLKINGSTIFYIKCYSY